MNASTGDQVNTIEALNQALDDAMAESRDVILLGEDIADGQGGGVLGVTRGLSTKYGVHRVRSTPISEQAIIGAAIGAALAGMRPVAEIMLMNFTAVAMDMIVNHAAKLRFMSGGQTHVPMTIRTMTGAGFGNGGQHSDYLEAWFAHTAGIRVVAPSCPADAYGLLRSCIADEDPCLFIENLPTYFVPGRSPNRGAHLPLGKAHVMRQGKDITLISYSRTAQECAVAAIELEKEGISAEVIDLRTIAPFDKDTLLASVARTRHALVAHEAVRPFGVGAEIAACLHEHLHDTLRKPVRRIGAPHCPVPFSKVLENAYLPNAAVIAASARVILQ